jgi:hypothetical protein
VNTAEEIIWEFEEKRDSVKRLRSIKRVAREFTRNEIIRSGADDDCSAQYTDAVPVLRTRAS